MRRATLLLSLLFQLSSAAASPQSISLWHSFSGHLGAVFDQLCQQFNHSQSDYRIDAVYKGNYIESLTSFAAAFRAHKAPAMIQVFEVGTATMLYPRGIIKPLYRVLSESELSIDSDDFLPAIKRYYSDDNNQLVALPFNSSVPVLFYNKALFTQAGLSAEGVPHTWQQLESVAKRLQQSGVKCAYTSAFPSWIHLESFSMVHRLNFTSNNQDVLARRVNLLQPSLINHIKRLVRWQQQGIFQYGGRESDASALFNSGHCAMMTQSSGSYQSLRAMLPFEVGISHLPYDAAITKKRANSIIGGAALWAVNGFDKNTYRGIAQFVKFMAQPQVQAKWQRQTGYLPVSAQALTINKHLPQFDTNLLIAVDEINYPGPPGRIRLGGYSQIRIINDEELEAAFAGTKTVEQALNDAQTRVNHVLMRFAKNVS